MKMIRNGRDNADHASTRPHSRFKRPGGIAVTSLVVLLLAATGFTTLRGAFAQQHADPATVAPLVNIAQIQQAAQKYMKVTPPSSTIKKARAFASTATTVAVPAFNNVGISDDRVRPTLANFDGGSYSYSAQALFYNNIEPGIPFIYNGIQYYMPKYAADPTVAPATSAQPDNWSAAGQILPLTSTIAGETIGLVGSATNGPVTSSVTVHYTDGTTATLPFTMSDWTLNGNRAQPASGNSIVAAQTYRNSSTAKQPVKTYIFETEIKADPNKTPDTVTLPNTNKIHIFAYAELHRTGPATDRNNTGMSDDANPTAANFDGGGYSYPGDTSNWGPGYAITITDTPVGADPLTFTWPDVLQGSPDNYVTNRGSAIPIPVSGKQGATRIAFVGAASGGATSGTVTVKYANGTSQNIQLGFSDWTLQGRTVAPSFGNKYFYAYSYRNSRSGPQNVPTFLFYADFTINPSSPVVSVTLPATTSPGALHVFSVATSMGGYYDNVGFTQEPYSLFGNYDGGGHSYSITAMEKVGYSPYNYTFNGVEFNPIDSGNVFADNWIANGQTIGVKTVAGATALGLLGSAVNGSSSGSGTIYYTDGSSAPYNLGFSDWCAPTASFGNQVVASASYQNTSSGTGTRTIHNSIYYAEVPLDPTKTVSAITLPRTTGGTMHVIAVGERTAYNNAGISSDRPATVKIGTIGNFDGGSASYSATAMANAGLASGQADTTNGFSFNVPAANQGDNYAAVGQKLTIDSSSLNLTGAHTLGFLGSANNGPMSGNITITYTDGTTATASVAFSDWCNSSSAATNHDAIAATMSYRNTSAGTQTINNYLYVAQVPLNSAKTVQSITLPVSNHMHFFAYAFK